MKEIEKTLLNYQDNSYQEDQRNSALGPQDVTAYLTDAQGAFLDTLALIGKGKNGHDLGMEHIVYDPHRQKYVAMPDWYKTKKDSAVFTGDGFCGIAISSLHDGLSEHVGSNLIMNIMSMSIWFNKEDFGGAGAFYREKYGGHLVLKVSDPKTESSVFIDPTYGQVNYLWAGKFLFFQLEEIGNYYQTYHQTGVEKLPDRRYPAKRPLTQEDLVDVTGDKSEGLKYLRGLKDLTEDEYSQLVQVISGEKI